MTARLCVSILSALAVLLEFESAFADEPLVAVTTVNCDSLDVPSIEHQLTVELRAVGAQRNTLGNPSVQLWCRDDVIEIAVSDSLTDKRLERHIPAPTQQQSGRERTIALAVSQLFITSWLELLLPSTSAPGAGGPPASAPPAAVREIAVALRDRLAGRPTDWEIALLGGARGRDVDTPFPAWGAGIRGGFSMNGHLWLFADASGEVGMAERTRGVVDVYLASVGLAMGVRSRSVGPLSFGARVRVAPVYFVLQGQSASPRVNGLSASAFSVDASLAGEMLAHAGLLQFGIALEVGYMLPTLAGSVTDEASVDPGGVWAGASLSVGVASLHERAQASEATETTPSSSSPPAPRSSM